MGWEDEEEDDQIGYNPPSIQDDPYAKPSTINAPPDWLTSPVKSAWDWLNAPFDWAKDSSEPSKEVNAIKNNPAPIPSMVSQPLGSVGPAWDAVKAMVGSPFAAASTGAALGSGGLSSLVSAVPALGKVAPVVNAADRLMQGASSIAQAKEAGDNISKGNYAGAAMNAGMSYLGYEGLKPKGLSAVKAPNINPLDDFILENVTPRTKDFVERSGYTMGERLPVDPQTGVSPGTHIFGDSDFIGPKASLPVARVKNTAKTADEAMQNWIGDRQALDTEALIKWKDFGDLKDVDPVSYQNYLKTGEVPAGADPSKLDALAKSFEDKYSELRNSGLKFGFKESYLPQIWADDPAKVREVLGQRLTKNPSFTFESVVNDYQAGIDQGLTPKFDNVPELAQWYEKTANKAIADTQLFDWLKSKDQLSTTPKPGYSIVDPNLFPSRRITPSDGKLIIQNWYVPNDVKMKLDNFLKNPAMGTQAERLFDKSAGVSSTMKNLAMSSGPVPGTAINFHGFNETVMNSLTDPDGMVKGAYTGAKYMLNPQAAQKSLESNLKKVPFWQRQGLQVGIEDVPFKGQEGTFGQQIKGALKEPGLLGKTKEVLNVSFENPMFQKMVPALKVERAEQYYDILRNQGLSVDEAAKTSAKFTNEAFGGLNYDRMFRDKTFQNVARTVGLAPDWFESGARITGGMGKALLNSGDPKSTPYLNTARNVVSAYVMANVTNKVMSGHYMYENDPGKKLMIELPGSESISPGQSKKRYIPVFGTTLSGLQIPAQVAGAIADKDSSELGKPLLARLSPPANLVKSAVTGKNYFDQKIVDPKQSLTKNLGRVGTEFTNLLPPYGRLPFDLLSGAPPEEALMRGFELPVRYESKKRKVSNRHSPFDY